MMQLTRIVLVQWHLFGREDLDISGNAAILGKNRSGKSTVIDLIQTVMTGGSARWYRFNRSAGETGGSRSERSLRGYCLGQLGEQDYLREEAVTHIALVFDDPEGKRQPVSVGLCIEASVRDDAQIVGRYVARGVRVDTELFIEQLDDSRQQSASWSLVRTRLEEACVGQGAELLKPDTALNYVREYMRMLFTGRRHSDPMRFVRAFVMALSFEDMRSVEGFVHNFLLEKNDIDIGELRDSIQRYRDIQKDIHELERRLEALRALRALVTRFMEALEREEIARGVERLAALIEAGSALMTNLRKLRDNRAEFEQISDEIARQEAEIRAFEDEEESIQAQLRARDEASQRAVVSSELKSVEHERRAVADRLQKRFLSLMQAVSLFDHREKLGSLKLGVLFQALEAIRARSVGLMPPTWPRDPVEMERLIDTARDAAAANLPKLRERRNEAIVQRISIQQKVEELNNRLRQARSGHVEPDARTSALMAMLAGEGMRPRALFQVVDIINEDWREAAEALLGRDREAIIVDPEHASRAVAILRGNRDAFRGCRVVNTRRLADDVQDPKPGTLASIFTSDDPLAMAFIVFRNGTIRLAETQAELLSGGRTIMKDGAYNSGIVVEVLRTHDLKIGKAAAPLMEAESSRQLTEQRGLLAVHTEAERFYENMEKKLASFIEAEQTEDRLDRIAVELNRCDEQRTDLQKRLDRIAATIDPTLQSDLDRVKKQLRMLGEDRAELIGRRGQLINAGAEIENRLDGGESLPGSRRCLASRRRLFRERVRNSAQLAVLDDAYKEQRPKLLARVVAEMAKRAEEAKDAYRACEAEIREALGHYRMQFDSTAPVAGQDQISTSIRSWVEANTIALENNELIQYRRQADEAADQIGRLFRTAFIHELNDRFNAMEKELENLRRALQSRPLHGEVYTLHAYRKDALVAMYKLARESESDESLFDALFGRADPRDEEHARALKEIERLLTDEEFDFTAYQDYRNYFRFDLQMQDEATGRKTSYDSRKGTASGAERQVPYYVIIGAAVASIYHGSRHAREDRGDLGLGLAVFDEAFSKMDGPNQRTLLDFYHAIGLQVVIAAPMEKRSVIYENLDSIVDVFRYDDQATTETTRIKPYAQARMRAVNPEHLSDAQLAARLETPNSDAAE